MGVMEPSPSGNTSAASLCAHVANHAANWTCIGSWGSSGYLLEVFKPQPSGSAALASQTCVSRILLPAENLWSYQFRAVLYSVALAYLFVALACITTLFMRAMETIVRQTREVVKVDPVTKEEVRNVVRIWNPTIADITLLALGTSAPQISLALIDAFQQLGKDTGGGLGAGTILGSAAFNIFPILAVCVVLPPKATVKRIENFGVWIIELAWSLWAYVWVLIVLQVSSPNVVTIWEALLTLIQLPILMLHAYGQDQGWSYALPFQRPPPPPPLAEGSTHGASNDHVELAPPSVRQLLAVMYMP